MGKDLRRNYARKWRLNFCHFQGEYYKEIEELV